MLNPLTSTSMKHVFGISELKLLIVNQLNLLFLFSLKLTSKYFYHQIHVEGDRLESDFGLIYEVLYIYKEIFQCDNADQVAEFELLKKFPYFANREFEKSYVMNAAALTGRLDIIVHACEIDCAYERYIVDALESAVKGGHVHIVSYFCEMYQVTFTPIFLCWAIEEGMMVMFEYLREAGAPYGKGVAMSAVRSKSLEVLKFLHEDGCPWDMYSSQEAVKIGDFEIVKYLHQNGCPFNENHTILAIKEGNMENIEYLCSQGYVPNDACDVAVKNGQLEALWYLHGRGLEWTEETAQLAMQGNNVEMMFFLLRNQCPGSDTVEYLKLLIQKSMSTQPTLTILKFILTSGFQLYTDISIDAVEMNRLDVLEYLNNNGILCVPELFNTAIKQNNMSILNYLLSLGLKWNEHSLGIALNLKDLDLVKFLVKAGCSWKESIIPEEDSQPSNLLTQKVTTDT